MRCKFCGMSDRNSIHKLRNQYGYHQFEPIEQWAISPIDMNDNDMRKKLKDLYEWLDGIGDGAPDASPIQKRALNEAAEIGRLLERAK